MSSQIITYDDATELHYDPALVEVSGSTVRLKDLGGSTYSTANPAVASQHTVAMTEFISLSHTVSTPAGSEIKYQLIVNDRAIYYNSSTLLWEYAAANTYAYANTFSELASFANIAANLSLTGSFNLRVRAFLHSDAGSARPSITSFTIQYRLDFNSQNAINECLITCYMKDLLGDVNYSADYPVTLNVKNHRAFMHGNTLIQPFIKSVTFDSSGYAQISVIETETVAEELEFFVTYFEGLYKKTVRFVPAEVPNAATANMNEVSQVSSIDVG